MNHTIKPRYLVMVTSVNNNKYYKQIPHGDTWTAEYGRVGAAPQTAEYPMSKWESKFREKIKKGYVDQSDLVEDLIEVEKPKTKSEYKEIENKAIAEIVERLQAMARQAISDNYSISSNKVTKAMVDEAQNVLTNLLAILSVSDFNDELIHLFTVIPRAMKEVSYYLASSKDDIPKIIKREQDLLDVMKGQVVVKKAQDNLKETESKEENPHTILEALGLVFEECDDEDIEIIKKNLGADKSRFCKAWRVTNTDTRRRFNEFVTKENIKDTRLLWHGSRNENWWSIINTGLVLSPTNAVITGKMFGYGIYTSSLARKSVGYSSLQGSYWAGGQDRRAYMALMEVAYGKPYDVYSFDSRFYKFNYDTLKKASPLASCLHAHAGSMLRNDEIVIYREDQITIKYLVEIE